MTIELIISRLIGKAEQGDSGPSPESAANRALSRRLRELVSRGSGPAIPDRGQAEEALRLAAYLDGTMDAAQRAEFERELAHSPQRRDELIGAAAWLDQIESRKEAPPADVSALALAFDDARPAISEPRQSWIVGLLDSLFPRPRLAVATSAIASIAILAVGVDIALRLNPHLLPQPASTTSPARPVATPGNDLLRAPADMNMRPPRFALPARQLEVKITPEVIEALIAYHGDPSLPRRQELIAALARAGMTPLDAGSIQSIAVQRQLYERLAVRSTVGTVSLNLSANGDLVIGVGRE